MEKKSKKEKNLKILAVCFFVLIFLNDTTVYNVYFETFSNIFVGISCCILLIFIASTGKLFINKKFWAFIFFWFITVLTSCLIAGFTRMTFVRICYWTVTITMVTQMYLAKIDLKSTIYSVCKIFCIWCLLCYFYASFNLNFLPTTHVSKELAYNHYSIKLYGGIISIPISHIRLPGSISLYRLDRPFGEPGIAQIFMNYGIIYYSFILKESTKKEKKWFYLFVLGSILTFSLTGYIILFSILIFKLYQEKKYTYCFIFSFIAIVIGSFMVFQKVNTFSYSDRTGDYKFMISTIFENLPFGIGIGNTNSLEHYIIEGTDNESIGFYCRIIISFSTIWYIWIGILLCFI